MTMYLRRRAAFSAAFSRPQPDNNGRGHDYLCELTVGGAIDAETGMVINIKEVDAVLKTRVVGQLGGKLLDTDVAAFQDTLPTPENLARFLWDECRGAFSEAAQLARVTLWPSSTLQVALSTIESPQDVPMLTVTRTYDFSASHRLHSHVLSDEENAEIFGKCNWENGHGHNYDVEVTLSGNPDEKTGRLVDLEALDKIVEDVVLKPYDHKHLNYDLQTFAN